jgi:hypothetical protein
MPIFKGQMKSKELDSINSMTIRDRLVPKMETLRTFTSCIREDSGLLALERPQGEKIDV